MTCWEEEIRVDKFRKCLLFSRLSKWWLVESTREMPWNFIIKISSLDSFGCYLFYYVASTMNLISSNISPKRRDSNLETLVERILINLSKITTHTFRTTRDLSCCRRGDCLYISVSTALTASGVAWRGGGDEISNFLLMFSCYQLSSHHNVCENALNSTRKVLDFNQKSSSTFFD